MSLDSIIQKCLSFFIWGAQKITNKQNLSITVYANQNLHCLTIQVVGTDSCVIMITALILVDVPCSFITAYMHGKIAIEHNNCLGFEDLYQYTCMQRLDCFTACFIFMIVHDIVVITV